MKKVNNSLLTWNETKQVGFNGYKCPDNGMVFEDENGMPYSINPNNLEYVVNFSNPELPSGYYRENKVFTHKN